MNIYYTKTVLYAYANIETVKGQIDDFVERKAISSMSDYTPCIEQCESILNYTAQKVALIELKELVEKVLKKLSNYELDCLDYKYFKQKPKEYYTDFDCESRGYFRRQVSLVKKIAENFENVGLTDEWFKKNLLTTNFFKELLKRVEEQEKQNYKNKKKKQKKNIFIREKESNVKLSA